MNIFQNRNLQEEEFATKVGLKNATDTDTSDFAKKIDLSNLKSDVDKFGINNLKNVTSALSSLKNKINKLDIGKLEITPVDLSKLSNVVKNNVVKKDVYNAKIKDIIYLI